MSVYELKVAVILWKDGAKDGMVKYPLAISGKQYN